MQRRSPGIGVFPLLCLPFLMPLDAEARVVAIGGWACNQGGVGVGGGPIEWGGRSDCVYVGGGAGGGGGGREGGSDSGGGSRAAKPNNGADEQETSDQSHVPPCDQEISGNPVVLYTGNKIEHELDFATSGEMALFLQRTYNHFWNGVGLFGKHWLSNFDYTIGFSSGVAWAQRPDGRRIKFRQAASSNRWDEDRALPLAYIVRNADGTYTLHNEERGTETYSTDGYILQRRNAQGVTWNFTYSGKYLQRVTHASGRSVQFAWSNGQLVQVTDPAGNAYRYAYTPDVFGTGRGRLASTVLPATPATTIAYHHEDARFPAALTGKSFNGVRYSTFAFDAGGRAISTEHAGGVMRHTFGYSVEASEQLPLPPPTPAPGGYFNDDERGGCVYKPGEGRRCYAPHGVAAMTVGETTQARPTRFRVTETNPLGRKTTHLYEDGKKVSVTGDATPHCPASARDVTYDANGYEDMVKDFAGSATDFDHDAHGHVLKQVEGVGTSVTRTRIYTWDEAHNRLTGSTLQGLSATAYTYTANGRIASEQVIDSSSGQARTTTYAYTTHANGMLASTTVDGPLPGDTVTFNYSATGDLLQVRNAAGHATNYSGHNALGQATRVTSPAGAVTEYVYDARGRIVVERTFPSGTPVETRYVYGASGLLDAVQTAEGNTFVYHYDAARRLIQEDKTEPDGSFAVRRVTYNALSQPTKVEVGRDTP